VALVAGLLALAPPPGEPRRHRQAPPWRPLLGGELALLSAGAFVSYLGAAALPFLVALYAEQHLRVSPELTGLALLGFGVAGMALSPLWGRLIDRFSTRWSGAAAAVATGAGVAGVGLTRSALTLALCWTAAGAAASLLNVALQNLTVRAVPENRGGALSAVSAFRFTGAAIAPVALVPVYSGRAALSFFVAAGTLLFAVAALLALPRRVEGRR
jgi:predicted MFS family arabinose efflux permease